MVVASLSLNRSPRGAGGDLPRTANLVNRIAGALEARLFELNK
jgi:hypothetical protein